jgi:hypothetical protein
VAVSPFFDPRRPVVATSGGPLAKARVKTASWRPGDAPRPDFWGWEAISRRGDCGRSKAGLWHVSVLKRGHRG